MTTILAASSTRNCHRNTTRTDKKERRTTSAESNSNVCYYLASGPALHRTGTPRKENIHTVHHARQTNIHTGTPCHEDIHTVHHDRRTNIHTGTLCQENIYTVHHARRTNIQTSTPCHEAIHTTHLPKRAVTQVHHTRKIFTLANHTSKPSTHTMSRGYPHCTPCHEDIHTGTPCHVTKISTLYTMGRRTFTLVHYAMSCHVTS